MKTGGTNEMNNVELLKVKVIRPPVVSTFLIFLKLTTTTEFVSIYCWAHSIFSGDRMPRVEEASFDTNLFGLR